MEASVTGRKDTLENILQELFSADAAIHQVVPNAPRPTVDTGLAALRRRLKLFTFPADKVLDALCAAAASDGKLTRAEFDADLKQLAKTLGIAALSTTREMFDLFDDRGEGILHIQDLAAGLAVLCDTSMAQFVQCACQLYRGPDGDSGFDDIFGLTLSIIKVLYTSGPADWPWPGMLPHEVSAVVSSEFFLRKGLPLNGRVTLHEWSTFAALEETERSNETADGGCWGHLLQGLRKYDITVVLGLLSAFVDQHGGISRPAFVGCMRALFEEDGRCVLSAAETMELKISLTRLYQLLDGDRMGTVAFRDLASGISLFCGNINDASIRAMFEVYGTAEGSIARDCMRKFLEAIFKVLFHVDPGARVLAGNGGRGERVDPAYLAETATAHAFEDAVLNPDGTLGSGNFHRWYSRFVQAPVTSIMNVGEIRYMKGAESFHNLGAAACSVRVSWMPFLRYCCGLVNYRPLMEESRTAAATERRDLYVDDEGMGRNVDLHARLHSKVHPSTSTAANSNEASWTEPDEVPGEPEKIAERSANGSSSKEGTQAEGRLCKRSPDEVESPLSESLEQARRVTRLCNTSVAQVVGVLKDFVNDRGRLARVAVHQCVRRLRTAIENETRDRDTESVGEYEEHARDQSYSSAAADHVINRLFDAVDVHNAGDVNFCEVASALSVLCGDTRQEKMRAIFNLFLGGEESGITARDIATYTTSAFRAMYKLQPSLKGEVGIAPEAMGILTASSMMEGALRKGDGRISPRDFSGWLSDAGSPHGAEGFARDAEPLEPPGNGKVAEDDARPDEDVELRGDREVGHADGAGLLGKQHVVVRARKLLCLDCFNVMELMEILAEVTVTGTVALDDMWRCIGYLLQLGGTREGTAEWDNAFFLTQRIHRAFQDHNGIVGFAALTCGISILCELSVEDKILVAFALFDTDGDGQLTLEELTTCIASVLRVVCAVGQDVKGIANPDRLGAALAAQCFKQAQVSIDEKLGIDDFRLFLGGSRRPSIDARRSEGLG
ncbi:unnamed protein product [Ectocarpus fasciculatus]